MKTKVVFSFSFLFFSFDHHICVANVVRNIYSYEFYWEYIYNASVTERYGVAFSNTMKRGVMLLFAVLTLIKAFFFAVTLLSCTHETASLRIDNATSGGILYIRTDTAYNIIPTTDGTIFYTCAFEICNIKWVNDFYRYRT